MLLHWRIEGGGPIKCSKLKLFLKFPTISMIYLSTREILQNMNIFKENTPNFSNFF